MRLTGVSLGADFTFAHRALCARAMRRRAASETMRLPPVLVRPAVVRVPPFMDSRAVIAFSMRPRSCRSSASIVWMVMGRNSTTAPSVVRFQLAQGCSQDCLVL